MAVRINRDIEKLSFPGIRSISRRANPFQCDIHFQGPVGSSYFRTVFHILVEFPETYPFSPPSVTFLQDIDIPEVDLNTGKVRMRILDPRIWKASSSLQDVMMCLYYTLRTQLPSETEDE
jgi:ubiquitin-protein ligase